MQNHRKAAVIAGILFIFAIVMLFTGEALYRPILDASDYLAKAHPGRIGVVAGVMIEFTGVPAVVFIAIVLFPVLKQHSEGMAVGYVAFRLFEAAVLSIAYVCKLSMINLSRAYLAGGAGDAAGAASLNAAGETLKAIISWSGTTGMIYLTAFCIGSLILYFALYQSRLVPRFIAGFGLFAAVLLLVGALLESLGAFPEKSAMIVELVVASPIALTEIGLSIWLIAKGFNPIEQRAN